MKVSVIMPVYNRAEHVGPAIRSLLRQRPSAPLDIIVVDDGSTDATPDVVRAVAAQSPCIRLIRQDNRGVTNARNAGLRHVPADADLISFLDSDDIWPAGRLAADLQDFAADPAIDVTYGLMQLVDQVDDERLEPAAGCRSATVRGISLAAGTYRPKWFTTLGGFDEEFRQAEDTDFLIRLLERRPRIVYAERVAVIYRRHAGNMTRQTNTALKSMMLALHKSVKRRQADPSLASMQGVFDFQALQRTDWF
jgi:glycosyltransferase involved in cell wall biosynthesis